jgi:hypothetical protein
MTYAGNRGEVGAYQAESGSIGCSAGEAIQKHLSPSMAPEAPSVVRPSLAVNDEWAYQQSSETAKLGPDQGRRVTIGFENRDGTLVVASSPLRVPSTQRVWRPEGPIPAGTCLIDPINRDTLGLPDGCNAKLQPGDTWTTNQENTAVHSRKSFRVVEVGVVEVPAGKFLATRIDAEEYRSEVTNPMELGSPIRTVTRYWYATRAKGMVKIERERYNPSGKRTDHALEVLVESSAP